MNPIMEAVHLLETNQIEKAIASLENHLLVASDEDKYAIADIYLQWGFLQEAKDILTELINLYPTEGQLKILLAHIYIEFDDDEAAMDLLNDIEEDDVAYVQALLQLADLYQAQGLIEVAEHKLLVAKQLEPNEEIIDLALGELLFSVGDYNRAITYYEKIKPMEIAEVSIKERLAEAYAALGKYELALEHFQAIQSDNPDFLFKYGFTAVQSGRDDIAIHAWEKVLEKDPYYHSAYYQLAKAYENEEMVQDAYETAKNGLKVDEFNKELFFLAGVLAHKLQDDIESKKLVNQAIAIDADYKEAILFLIELLKEEMDSSGIIDLITEIKKTGADDSLYEWELARAYKEIESFDNALNHYAEAYNSLNQDTDFLKEYGYILIEEGRTKEGLDVFEKYLTIQPLDYELDEYVQRLKQE